MASSLARDVATFTPQYIKCVIEARTSVKIVVRICCDDQPKPTIERIDFDNLTDAAPAPAIANTFNWVSSSSSRRLELAHVKVDSGAGIRIFESNIPITLDAISNLRPTVTKIREMNMSSIPNGDRLFESFERLRSVIKLTNTSHWKSMSYIFYNCSSLTEVGDFDTSSVVGMEGAFRNCRRLHTIGLTSIPNVESLNSTFAGCESLRHPPAMLSTAKNVKSFFHTFAFCSSLNAAAVVGDEMIVVPSNQIVNFGEMFKVCESLTRLDTFRFNTSGAYNTNMQSMFQDCSKLESIPDFIFPSPVVSTSNMFLGCRELREVDLSGFDTPFLQRADQMFGRCFNLRAVNLFRSMPCVETLESMFQYCISLQRCPLIEAALPNVTTMSSMFFGCTSLGGGAQPPTGPPHYNTSPKLRNIACMFSGCTSLSRTEDIPIFTDLSGVFDANCMFFQCSRLSTIHPQFIELLMAASDVNVGGMFDRSGCCRCRFAEAAAPPLEGPSGAAATVASAPPDREYMVFARCRHSRVNTIAAIARATSTITTTAIIAAPTTTAYNIETTDDNIPIRCLFEQDSQMVLFRTDANNYFCMSRSNFVAWYCDTEPTIVRCHFADDEKSDEDSDDSDDDAAPELVVFNPLPIGSVAIPLANWTKIRDFFGGGRGGHHSQVTLITFNSVMKIDTATVPLTIITRSLSYPVVIISDIREMVKV